MDTCQIKVASILSHLHEQDVVVEADAAVAVVAAVAVAATAAALVGVSVAAVAVAVVATVEDVLSMQLLSAAFVALSVP